MEIGMTPFALYDIRLTYRVQAFLRECVRLVNASVRIPEWALSIEKII